MPGHSQAAIAAYPALGNTSEPVEVYTRWGISGRVLNVADETLDFCRHVFDEVLELFPSLYIGIGGDECPKDEWRSGPQAQERMRALGLRDADELQSWFVGQLDEYLTAHGRRLYGWDEILEGGLAPGANRGLMARDRWRARRRPCRTRRRALPGQPRCTWTTASPTARTSRSRSARSSTSRRCTPSSRCPRSSPVRSGSGYWARNATSGPSISRRREPSTTRRFPPAVRVRRGRVVDAGAGPWPPSGADWPRISAGWTRSVVEYRSDGGPLPWQTRPDAQGWPRDRAARETELAIMTARIAR